MLVERIVGLVGISGRQTVSQAGAGDRRHPVIGSWLI
jgi:hypothetical protein